MEIILGFLHFGFIILIGAVLLLTAYFLFRKISTLSAAKEKLAQETPTKLEDLKEKTKELRAKYEELAFLYSLDEIADKSNLDALLNLKRRSKYGMFPPKPFVEWGSVVGYGLDFDICKTFEAELTEKAYKDAEIELKKFIDENREL